MRTYVAATVMAFVVSLVCVPIVAWLARKLGAMSVPGQRDVHTLPIPRLGGVAITVATIAPILTLFVVDTSVAKWVRNDWNLSVGLILGGLGLCAVGALDDTRPVRARYKLLAQLLTAVFAYALGFRINTVFVPFVGSVELGLLSIPFTVAWIVGVTNAVNLIDGLDGLAAGVVFFAASAGFAVAVINGSVFVALVMCCVGGSILGFLRYNFNPARIFMGDSGSYFLGFTLACASLAGASHQKASTTVSLLVPILALGLPIFDTLVAMTRRKLEGRSVFSPDQGHIHHRLIARGLSQRKTVFVLYAVSLVLATCAIVVSFGRDQEVGIALFLATTLMLGLITFARSFSLDHLKPTRGHERLCDLGQGLRGAMVQLPLDFHRAGHESELWSALECLAAELQLLSIQATLVDSNRTDFSWRSSDTEVDTATAHRDEVSTRLEIRSDNLLHGELGLSWRASSETVNVQTEVLLQLVADQLGHALARLEARRLSLFEAAAVDTTLRAPQTVKA